MQLVDSHCHLTLDPFHSDWDQVVVRAKQAAVMQIVIPGIDMLSSRRAVELSETNEGLYAAVGIHPSSADQWQDHFADELRELAQSESVVAIGEIGLDYHHQYHPVGLQKEVLIKQLALAAELELPVILHNRESVADLIAILADWRDDLPEKLKERCGVLHAFEGPLRQGEHAVDLGFYLGIGGPVTFKNAEANRALIRQLPLERLLIETDAPYLAPEPHRGQRNEPAYTRLVAEALAGLHKKELGMVAKITSDNATKLFGWSNGYNTDNLL